MNSRITHWYFNLWFVDFGGLDLKSATDSIWSFVGPFSIVETFRGFRFRAKILVRVFEVLSQNLWLVTILHEENWLTAANFHYSSQKLKFSKKSATRNRYTCLAGYHSPHNTTFVHINIKTVKGCRRLHVSRLSPAVNYAPHCFVLVWKKAVPPVLSEGSVAV